MRAAGTAPREPADVRWWQRLRAAVRRRVDRVRVRRRDVAPAVGPAVGTRGLGVVGSIAAVTDPTPTPPPDDPGEEMAVDVRAFLPDGVSLEGADATDTSDELAAPSDADDDRPEPEIPAWALDDPAEPAAEVEVEANDAAAEVDGDVSEDVDLEVDDADDESEAIDDAEAAAVDVELVEVEGLVVVDAAPEPSEPEPVSDEVAEPDAEPGQADAEPVVEQDVVDQGDDGEDGDQDDEVDDGPALPAWALPDPIVDQDDDVDGADDAAQAVAEGGPAVNADAGSPVDGDADAPEAEKVDTSVLEQIEGELAEVEEALAAIDAGDLTRSPLLVRLLADQG